MGTTIPAHRFGMQQRIRLKSRLRASSISAHKSPMRFLLHPLNTVFAVSVAVQSILGTRHNVGTMVKKRELVNMISRNVKLTEDLLKVGLVLVGNLEMKTHLVTCI
jgi:hypothetical protein